MSTPLSNRGVYPPIGVSPCEGFDAYSPTVYHAADPLFDDLFCLMESAGFEPIRAEGQKARFYARNRVLLDPKGHQLLACKSGGSNPHPHVECTGIAARTLAIYLRQNYRHRPTRIDHAVDRRAPGLFDQLHAYSVELCKQHKLSGKPAGDWVTPDAGRTFYLGSRQSQVCVRIYEKGLKYAHDLGLPVTDELREWVRIEIEFKPQTEAAKNLAPTIEGPQIWGSTGWTNQLACEVLSMATEPVSIRERRESDRERALRFMGIQYGAHLRSVLDECGGDFAEFGRFVAALAGAADHGKQAA